MNDFDRAGEDEPFSQRDDLNEYDPEHPLRY